jgi:hypothetical protein
VHAPAGRLTDLRVSWGGDLVVDFLGEDSSS